MEKIEHFLDKHRIFLVLVFIFAVSFAMISHQMVDYDYWFHYATGEYIVKSHAIPKTAIYSWYGTENNLSWISHEWLFGLFIYEWTNIIGYSSLSILCPALVSLSITFAFWISYDKWINYPLIGVVTLFMVAITGYEVLAPRPQLLMYLMFVGLCYIFINESYKPSNKIWFLPFLTILWVNIHGGSYALIFVLFLFLIVTQSFNFNFGKFDFKKIDNQWTLKRIAVFFISLACVIINPHGLKMYLYPFTNMSDTTMVNSISEWQSINFNSLQAFEIVWIIFVAVYFILIISFKKKINPFRFLLACAFIFLGVKSIRFIFQTSLVMVMLLPEYFGNIKELHVKDLEIILIISTIIFVCWTVYDMDDYYGIPLNMSNFPSDEMIETLQELPEDTKLFNTYNIGGYLMYNHINIFIDGRADIYSKYNLSDYMKIQNLSEPLENLIDEYKFEYLLVKKDSKVDYWCEIQTKYTLEVIQKDNKFVLYKIHKD